MTYLDDLAAAREAVPSTRIDFNARFKKPHLPTSANSDFAIHREQGDWAEQTVRDSINAARLPLFAVSYGRADKIMAGEPGFKAFFEAYQEELKRVGKRPDLLLFPRSETRVRPGQDISQLPQDRQDALARAAVAGLEVRSSAYLVRDYDRIKDEVRARIRDACHDLLSDPGAPSDWKDWAGRAAGGDYADRPRQHGTASRDAMTRIVDGLAALGERQVLSITAKQEDFVVSNRWIEAFGVPLFYVQVFFDQAVILGFVEILQVLAGPLGHDFRQDKPRRSGQKPTFSIAKGRATVIMPRIDPPRPEDLTASYKIIGGRLVPLVGFRPRRDCPIDAEAFMGVIHARGHGSRRLQAP